MVIVSILAFVIYAIPNSKGSEDMGMITMFEPDEATMLPYVYKMISPQPDLLHTIGRFLLPGFYSYGLPHFALSAVVLKVLSWFGQADNMSLVMLALRQIVSVLPMIAGLWILVYMQDQFKSWRSIALFVFLLSLPAVVRNGYWWHPDGLAILFSSLILFFLWKDQRQFGKYFYIAAAITGVLISLKVIGLFFFLTIGTILVLALVEKQISWKQAFGYGLKFVLVMALFILLSSPALLVPSHRELAINRFLREVNETSKGYGVFYEKGLVAGWQTIRMFFGEIWFLLITLGVSVYSLWDKKQAYLRILIFTWFIPLSIHILFFSHFKYQYWLPAVLPVFSNLILLIPSEKSEWKSKDPKSIIKYLFLFVVLIQFGLFIVRDVQLFNERNKRVENNPAISFYHEAVEELAPVQQEMQVYFDYRLYVPGEPGWHIDNSFDLLTYDFINSRNFDLLFLSHQRIRDYLQPSVTGIHPDEFKAAQEFYRDADSGNLENYVLLKRDETALLYLRQDLCEKYYEAERCK